MKYAECLAAKTMYSKACQRVKLQFAKLHCVQALEVYLELRQPAAHPLLSSLDKEDLPHKQFVLYKMITVADCDEAQFASREIESRSKRIDAPVRSETVRSVNSELHERSKVTVPFSAVR